MNKDLEEHLKELGPDCQAVVDRLRTARTVEPSHVLAVPDRSAVFLRRPVWLVAASLLFATCFSIHLFTSEPSKPTKLSYGAREYRQSISEMIMTQRPDGSWQNDFLTRRNVKALSKCEGAEARIAYKKAMRNLRARGIL